MEYSNHTQMKYEKTIYAVGTILIIAASLTKIMHLPYSWTANSIITFVFAAMAFFQGWLVMQLKKKIKELESK